MPNATKGRRPAATEYDGFYSDYVNGVPDGDLGEILREQLDSFVALVGRLSESQLDHRYEPGKWSVKEVFGHMVDAEWIFTYRALRFARADETPLPGMDQDVFMAHANFGERDIAGMISEFQGLRTAGAALFHSFDDTTLDRVGTASGCQFSVRALGYIIAGHGLHHIDVLKGRYLAAR